MTLLPCFPLERFSFHLCCAARLPPGCRIMYSLSITANRNSTQAQIRLQQEAKDALEKHAGFQADSKIFSFARLHPEKPRKRACRSPVRHPSMRNDSDFNHGGPWRLQRHVRRSQAENASAELSSQANKQTKKKGVGVYNYNF